MTTKTVETRSEKKKAATKAARPRKVATPWGGATLLEEAKVAQRGSEREFSTLLQLLRSERGDILVRIAYTTDGSVRRGPVTLRAGDVARLAAAVAKRPALAAALGIGGGA